MFSSLSFVPLPLSSQKSSDIDGLPKVDTSYYAAPSETTYFSPAVEGVTVTVNGKVSFLFAWLPVMTFFFYSRRYRYTDNYKDCSYYY